MKKKALRLIAWLTGIFILGISTFTLVLYLNQDKVIKRVFTEANEILTAPVDYSSVNISLQKFPLASIRLEDVFCRGNTQNSKDTLVFAEDLFLEFHLWKLVLGDWSVEGITLSKGALYLNFPEEGDPNYKIWKDRESSESNTLFALNQVALSDVNFKLGIEKQHLEIKAFLNTGSLGGILDGSDMDLKTKADFNLNELRVQNDTLLAPEHVHAELIVSGSSEKLRLDEGTVILSDLKLLFSGQYEPENFALNVRGQDLPLSKLVEFYNRQAWPKNPNLNKVKGIANLDFSGSFPGSYEDSRYQVNFDVSQGQITGDAVKLKDVALSGSYGYQDATSELSISSFKGYGRTGELKGSLSIADFNAPLVNLKLQSDLDLAEWMLILPLDTLTDPSGRMAVDLDMNNQFKSFDDISADQLRKTNARGKIDLTKVGFAFRKSDKTIENLNASLSFGEDQLDIDNFYFQTGQSDVYLSGHFSNVLSYLFFENEKLKLTTQVRSQELHVEDFLLSGKSKNAEYSLEFARSLEMDIDIVVDQLYFDSFYAEQLKGNLLVSNDLISARNLAFKADQGEFSGDLSINMKRREEYRLMANLSATNADLHELFRSFKNFGQDELVAENIYGRSDMKIQMKSALKPNLYLPPESVYLLADLNIHDGILKNYQPMSALSDYADIEELKVVKFSQLRNQISIENSVIYIPEMRIESNVLDLYLSGKHQFNNSIDYAMQLKLADVLFKKRKRESKHSEFDEHLAEMERTDNPNVYVRMTGTTSYPIISLDKERMNQSIKKGFEKQGEDLRKIFTKKDKEVKNNKSSGIEYTLFDDEDEGGEK